MSFPHRTAGLEGWVARLSERHGVPRDKLWQRAFNHASLGGIEIDVAVGMVAEELASAAPTQPQASGPRAAATLPASAEELREQYQAGARDFTQLRLEKAILAGAELEGVTLNHAQLPGCNLDGAGLDGAQFIGADLEGAKLEVTRLNHAFLVGVNLRRTYMFGVMAEGACLRGADLSLSVASFCNWRGANFGHAKLVRARFSQSDFAGVNFSEADLTEVEWLNTKLTSADFSGTNLYKSNLRGADLSGALLEGARLDDSNLCEATLAGASGRPASRKHCLIDSATYDKSGWTPEILVEWRDAGAKLLDFDRFPDEARYAVTGFPRDPSGILFDKKHLEYLISQSIGQQPVSLIRIDLDHFKPINDTHGHHAGDEMLRAAFSAIRRALCDSDMAIRAGGDEVVVLLPGTAVERARLVAERILAEVAAAHIDHRGERLGVTASIGVASAPPESPASLDRIADERAIAAKRAGGARVHCE